MNKILLLQTIPGFGLLRIKRFLKENRVLINDDDYFYYLLKNFTTKSLDFYKDRVKVIEDNCLHLGVNILENVNPNIVDTPLLLYIKGNRQLLGNNKKIAVVGTREPSSDGRKFCSFYTRYLINNGWITVSGLARGCDRIAHRESILAGGNTIAVLPMGYKDNYASWILDNGLIVSEYPPYTPVDKFRCVRRNRIITGLSQGLFVVESKLGGGSEHSIRFGKKGGIPISYCIGFDGIEKYGAIKIDKISEFDQYLLKCIK